MLAHEGDALLMGVPKGQLRWRWRKAAVMMRRHASCVRWPPNFMPRGGPAPVVARAVAGVVRGARAGAARRREFWNRPPLPPATYLPNRETSSFFTATSTTATSWTSDPGVARHRSQGLLGERTFDFVNILRNPDARVALTPGRFRDR